MKEIMFTKEESLSKIRQYCAYQERCIAGVTEKLYSFGLQKNEAEEIILNLIEENYLNEERFAIQFARGKFAVKKWGKVKIRYALKQKQVRDNFIKHALEQIDENEYTRTLRKLAEQKLKFLKNDMNVPGKKRKLRDYLLQKGYEAGRIREEINKTSLYS